MNNVAIIGMGMVGQATAKLFNVKHTFDLQEQKTNATLKEIAQDRVIFLCLPTPVDQQGNYNTDDIKQTIKQLEQYGGGSIYVIRSTVFPGFAVGLQKELGINRIISNPEFLTESTWEQDIKHPPFVLLGGFDGVFLNDVKAVYEAVVKSPVILSDNTSAEMAKFALNGFFVTKVVYANAIYDYCQQIGANYEVVKEVFNKHPFGYRNHSEIFHKGGRGAGGKCLKKDGTALAYYSHMDIIDAICKYNLSLLQETGKQ